jgi:hypothetical protein
VAQIVLDGAIDLHCHFGPESVIGHIGVHHAVDAFEAARDAADLGFAAIVLKSHDFPSNQVAYAVGQTVPGVKAYGSICCDTFVGGLNPTAVETALRDGAAIVWMPTITSQQDVENGVTAMMGLGVQGIRLLDDDAGELVAEARQILDLVAEHDAILATGHTSKAEHFALARAFGRRGKLVVTHAMNAGAGPGLTVQECAELGELGALVELAAATCMGGHGPGVADVVKAIQAIGPEHVVLATDYGWSDQLPHPAVGLHDYVDALYGMGAREDDLRRMTCDNPARLLNL